MKKVNIKRKNVMKRKVKNEHGAIVVEANDRLYCIYIFDFYNIFNRGYMLHTGENGNSAK